MAFTNQTPNYGLPQYIGTDKPSWLVDINGAMSDIDTGIKAAKTVADGAKTKSDNNETTLNGMVRFTGIHTESITTDGVKTMSQILDDLAAALNAYVATKSTKYRFRVVNVTPDRSTTWPVTNVNATQSLFNSTSGVSYPIFAQGMNGSVSISQLALKTSGSDIVRYDLSTSTYTSFSSTVPSANQNASVTIEEYEIS